MAREREDKSRKEDDRRGGEIRAEKASEPAHTLENDLGSERTLGEVTEENLMSLKAGRRKRGLEG